MRITDATYRLIEELFGGRGVFDLFGKTLQGRTETIARIEATGEPAAALYLAIYAVGADSSLMKRAAQAVKRLLAPVRPDDLFALDQGMRRVDEGYDGAYSSWTKLKPEHLHALRQQISEVALFGILSFHQSGRVREEAVRVLAGVNNGDELPFLLIRLNDWVPEVRALARDALRARLIPSYATHFATNIALVHRLLLWKRVDHSSLLDWIVEYLRTPECAAAVDELLSAPDTPIRRLMFQVLARPHGEGYANLLQRALRDPDPTVRLWAMRQARAHLADQQVGEMARAAIADRYSRVRALAAYIYVEQLPDEAVPILKAALMDPAPTLRAIARFYLGKSEPVDFRAFYRTRIDSESPLEKATAIAALGDVGNAADADLIAPYAQDASPRIRAAALQTLDRLDGDRFVDQFLLALATAPPAAVKVAARALSKRTATLDLESLWQELARPHPAAVHNRILQLLFNAPKWDSLYYAMASLPNPDPRVVSLACNHVARWIQDFNRASGQPGQAQRARLLDAVEMHGHLLPASSTINLRFYLT